MWRNDIWIFYRNDMKSFLQISLFSIYGPHVWYIKSILDDIVIDFWPHSCWLSFDRDKVNLSFDKRIKLQYYSWNCFIIKHLPFQEKENFISSVNGCNLLYSMYDYVIPWLINLFILRWNIHLHPSQQPHTQDNTCHKTQNLINVLHFTSIIMYVAIHPSLN